MGKLPTIFELLDTENFRKRTPMYIGEWRISSLRTYLDSAFYIMHIYGIEEKETDPGFGDFHDWVANYYGWRESTAGWNNIILKECNGDEAGALNEFFKLYDKFKKRKHAPNKPAKKSGRKSVN